MESGIIQWKQQVCGNYAHRQWPQTKLWKTRHEGKTLLKSLILLWSLYIQWGFIKVVLVPGEGSGFWDQKQSHVWCLLWHTVSCDLFRLISCSRKDSVELCAKIQYAFAALSLSWMIIRRSPVKCIRGWEIPCSRNDPSQLGSCIPQNSSCQTQPPESWLRPCRTSCWMMPQLPELLLHAWELFRGNSPSLDMSLDML